MKKLKNLVKISQTVDIEDIPLIVYRLLETLEKQSKNVHFLIDQSKQKTINEEELNINHLFKNIEQVRQMLFQLDASLGDVYEMVKGYGNFLFGSTGENVKDKIENE